MSWTYGLVELDGTNIGEVLNPYERKFSKLLNGLDTASFRVSLSNPIVDEVLSRSADVLLLIYRDSTLEFVGDLLSVEEVGNGYRRVVSREGLLTRGLSIGDTEQSYQDDAAITARGLYEEVVPGDVTDAGLRQALVEAHVQVRKTAREVVTFDASITADEPTVAFNFAGPLWRLSKRIWRPSRVEGGSGLENDQGQILLQLVGDTNNAGSSPNEDTGIREGTVDELQHIAWGPVSHKPIAEAFTEIASVAVLPYEQPSSWTGSDDFNQSAGFLGGKTAGSGQTWTTNGFINQAFGNPISLEVTSTILHRRAAPNSSPADGLGEFAYLGSIDWTDTIVQVQCATESDPNPGEEGIIMGVLARYSPGASPPFTASWVMGYIASLNNAAGSHRVGVKKCVNGVVSNLFVRDDYGLQANVFNALRLQVNADGRFYIWAGAPSPTFPTFQGSGYAAELATGGSLDSGAVGLHDHKTTNGEVWRTYDQFRANVPTEDFVPKGIEFELAPVLPTADAFGTHIADLNVSQTIGQDRPHAVFEYGTGQPSKPSYGTDYEVGDTVVGRAKASPTSTSARFNGTFKIYGVDISIDEEGRVTEVPQLVPE